MAEVVDERLANFKPDRRVPGEVDKILHIFKSSSRVGIAPEELAKIRAAIERSVKAGEPVLVSFLWAFCWMSQSPWKFLQPHLIDPRLADYWAAYWLSMICRKVERVYSPGCEFYIIDEFPMVRLLDWIPEKAARRAALLRPVFSQFPCIKLVDLPEFEARPNVPTPGDPEVLATILAAPCLFGQVEPDRVTILMDSFYRAGEKDWSGLRTQVPDAVWNRASDIKTTMNQIGLARRTTGWLEHDLLGGRPYIDAAMIDRRRWSPRFCDKAMPQHGGTRLRTSPDGEYSLSIIPEYRLRETHDPVSIAVEGGEELYLYWLPR
jgi:hypothetical protein